MKLEEVKFLFWTKNGLYIVSQDLIRFVDYFQRILFGANEANLGLKIGISDYISTVNVVPQILVTFKAKKLTRLINSLGARLSCCVI